MLAYTLHWHVKLEKKNDENGEMSAHYKQLYRDFMGLLRQENQAVFDSLKSQISFRKQLYALSMKLKENKKEKFESKKQKMRELVKEERGQFDMRKLDPPRPCPVKPEYLLKGVEASSSTLFQSAMCPLKLDFYYTTKGDAGQSQKPYSVIYKHGDDVR